MGSDLHGLWILGVSVAALLVGPAIHRVARREPVTMAALDNFVLVIVVGLVTLEIFPAALELSGLIALLALLLGALGPALADGPLHRASAGTHSAALTLAIVGVALHSITDGVALASAHAAGSDNHALEAAVIAHQLPVSVAVWWLLSPAGPLRATAAMIGLGLATVAGFLLADRLFAALDTAWLGALQALFAGFLLHVLAHRSGPVDVHARRARVAASLGGLVGVALLAFLAVDDHSHADEPPMLSAVAELARTSAPVLLAAFTLALLVALTRARTRDPEVGPAAVIASLDRCAPWLTAGLLIAPSLTSHSLSHALPPALATTPLYPAVPATSLPVASLPPEFQICLLAVLAVPTHTYAPALLPLVALLIPLGVDPGAALACILVGPAASASRSPLVRLAIVAAVVGLALLADWTVVHTIPARGIFPDAAALALASLLLLSLARQTPQQFLRRLWSPPGSAAPGGHSHAQPHSHSHSHSHAAK